MLEDKKNTLVPTEIVIISAKLETNIKERWPCTLLETLVVQEMYCQLHIRLWNPVILQADRRAPSLGC